MKKIISFIITFVFYLSFSLAASAVDDKSTVILPTEATDKISLTMAINKNVIIANGVQTDITAPILVFNKTYVDLYAIAPYLDFDIQWVEAYIGFFKVNLNGTSVDFTLAFQWDELNNQKYKFFVKDDKIFVSLRELVELADYDISYADGLITIGTPVNVNNEIFDSISTYDFDEYVYVSYPRAAEHVVYPYQAYSYETMLSDAKKLQHMYPELIKTSSIGKSVEGRDLFLIKFGRGSNQIFVCGTHHAREYITTTYLMYAIDQFSYAYRTNSIWGNYNPKEILDNVTFHIVPMVNPDGVNLVQNGVYATAHPDEIKKLKIYESSQYGYSAWKANMNGVDLNWNYNKDWSSKKNKNPRGSSGFNGDHPDTEPETIAVSRYVDNIPFDAFVSFHTQGEIFYWADNEEDPTNIYNLIRKDTGFIGYIDKGTGIGGSFFDYVYRNFKKPTLTVELCPYVGNYPYPDSNFDTVWKPAKNVLLIVGNEIINKNSAK